jgi:hypothetical protein
MLSRIVKVGRAVLFAVALLGLSGAPLFGQASDCPESAVGGQSGMSYTLVAQSLVTETRTVQLSVGGECLAGTETSVTIEEQYNVGYYENSDGDIAKVDCRTGKIIGWA